MGKTAKGAVWLDPNKTSPFEFYQYRRNIGDADVMKCLRMLTFIPMEEIDSMDSWDDSRINEKKEILAYSLTELVHGAEEAKKARTTSRALFAGGTDDSNMPTTTLADNEVDESGIGIVDLVVRAALAESKAAARRLIQQGGISIDGTKVGNIDYVVEKERLVNGIKIRKGKKVYRRIICLG